MISEINADSGEWQLALVLFNVMDTGSGEWQLALGSLNEMNAGSGEWQLASGLLSEIDVNSEEWQLAVVLLSEMDVGGNKWQRASGLLNRINVGGYEWQLALALPSERNVGGDEWQLALGLLSEITLAATSGNSNWSWPATADHRIRPKPAHLGTANSLHCGCCCCTARGSPKQLSAMRGQRTARISRLQCARQNICHSFFALQGVSTDNWQLALGLLSEINASGNEW